MKARMAQQEIKELFEDCGHPACVKFVGSRTGDSARKVGGGDKVGGDKVCLPVCPSVCVLACTHLYSTCCVRHVRACTHLHCAPGMSVRLRWRAR